MKERANERGVCAVCAFSPGGCVVDQTPGTSVGLGVTVPDPRPELRLLSKLSTKTHLLSLIRGHEHSHQAFSALLFTFSGTQQR